MESLAAAPAQPRLAVSVVRGALLRIAQHVVRLGHRLEPLLGVLRPPVLVRVELHREPAVRLLDLVVGSGLFDPERDIEVSHYWTSGWRGSAAMADPVEN